MLHLQSPWLISVLMAESQPICGTLHPSLIAVVHGVGPGDQRTPWVSQWDGLSQHVVPAMLGVGSEEDVPIIGIPAAHPRQLGSPLAIGHHLQLGLVEPPVAVIPKEVEEAIAVHHGPCCARGYAVPVSQAAGVVGLQGEGLLAQHEVFGSFEEHQAPELLEVEGCVGVAGQAVGTALLGEARHQGGATVFPASTTWDGEERLSDHISPDHRCTEVGKDP